GRENDYIKTLIESKAGVVLLTDESNNPIEISKNLVQNGIDNIEVIVGERLSYLDEKISRFLVEDYEKNIRKYEMNVTVLRKV
ncbi:MAG: precorrin-6y C5,15-methyltransferase (decarboxylating) subunit CbiE, partial [Cetobacterium sp.]